MTSVEIAFKVVELLTTSSKNPNELGRFITDFTNATVRWIRPLFLIDEKEDVNFSNFKANPADGQSKEAVLTKIKEALTVNDEMTKEFVSLLQQMEKAGVANGIVNNVTGDKNTFLQNISGGTININNQ